jgi:Flp pilus assembly protein TadG
VSAPSADERGGARRGLRKDARGAVYVEFLIVFLPLFVMFMSLVQLAFVSVANLVAKHAAYSACRAAIVVLPDDPAFYGDVPVNKADGARLTAIQAAAKARLLAVSTDPNVEITFPSSPGGKDNKTTFQQDDTVRVHVVVDYPCKIPIGSRFVCNLLTLHKKLEAEAAMPMQGAGYEY